MKFIEHLRIPHLLTPTRLIIVVYVLALFFVPPMIQVLGVVLFAMYLFITEKIPIDMTAILIMLVLIVLGLVTPEQGVSGFSNSATITVLCMFILSGGIARTGVIQKLGHKVFKYAKNSLTMQLLLIAGIIAPLSGIFNNTAAVAIFLPMIMNLCRLSKTRATQLLIPLSFLAMMGGTLTLIGTSTNILANSILVDNGYESFSMFTFAKIGIIVLIVGTIYLLTIGRLLVPNRKSKELDPSLEEKFLAEFQIGRGSRFIGLRATKIDVIHNPDIQLIKIIRKDTSHVRDRNRIKIIEGDILVIKTDKQTIINLNQRDNEKILLNFNEERRRMPLGQGKIIKVVIPNYFNNKNLKKIDFWTKYQAAVIGVRRDEIETQRLADMTLKQGEVLLIKVAESNYNSIIAEKDIVLLEELEQKYDYEKTWKAVSIMALVVILAALNILPIMVSAILGVVLMFLTRCLSSDEIYNSVAWNIIFLLAGLIPLGIAIQESGAADYLAGWIAIISYDSSPLLIFAIFYLVTTLLTEVISNNAAVVLLVPVALAVATKLGINPISITLIIMFAASTSFLSPVGYQTNTMVYGAGNYKFTDFIKVGGLLNIILLIVTSLSVYYFFGV